MLGARASSAGSLLFDVWSSGRLFFHSQFALPDFPFEKLMLILKVGSLVVELSLLLRLGAQFLPDGIQGGAHRSGPWAPVRFLFTSNSTLPSP